MRRLILAAAIAGALAGLVTACGGPVTGPSQKPPPQPPPNNLPVIDSIAIRGSRANEPASFADASEAVDVMAKVHDDETPADQLEYRWSASAGTFEGTGSAVKWRAPADVPAPVDVKLTLTVVEKYGVPGGPLTFSHETSTDATLSLHDSIREVGGMSRQFLLDFSDTNIKNANYIMRNFGDGARCPDPREVASEREDVTRNFTDYRMTTFRIGDPLTTVNFNGRCPVFGTHGDACSVVPSFWDSIRLSDGARSVSDGNDIIAASYSTGDKRWWLCASRYQVFQTFGVPRLIR